MDRPAIPAAIGTTRVIAIGRFVDGADVMAIAEALVLGGIRAFELTADSQGAMAAIEALRRRFAAEELLIGAGTVLDIATAERALAAGAGFLIMPHTDSELVAWACSRGVPAFPGAGTASEVLAGWRAGAAGIKIFPASVAGAAFVREMRGPLPHIPLIPTGGLTLESAREMLRAGAVAVGMGSWLTGGGDPELIKERARQLLKFVEPVPRDRQAAPSSPRQEGSVMVS